MGGERKNGRRGENMSKQVRIQGVEKKGLEGRGSYEQEDNQQ